MGAQHRGRRGARQARRDDRAYREYVREEQRRLTGCIAGRMPAPFMRWVLITEGLRHTRLDVGVRGLHRPNREPWEVFSRQSKTVRFTIPKTSLSTAIVHLAQVCQTRSMNWRHSRETTTTTSPTTFPNRVRSANAIRRTERVSQLPKFRARLS